MCPRKDQVIATLVACIASQTEVFQYKIFLQEITLDEVITGTP